MKNSMKTNNVKTILWASIILAATGCLLACATDSRDWEPKKYVDKKSGVVYYIAGSGKTKFVIISDYQGTSETVEIPAKIKGLPVTIIGNEAFKGKKLTVVNLVIPASVTSIGNEAFANNNLSSVSFPDTLKIIGSSAFANNKLSSVIVPETVEIWSDAFRGNNLKLYEIEVIGSGTTRTATITGTTRLAGISGPVTIPEKIDNITVTAIGDNAYAEKQLTGVSFPKTIKTIGEGAFRDNKISSIAFNAGLVSIGNNAFQNNQLEFVMLPETVTTVGSGAFDNNKLKRVFIINKDTKVTASKVPVTNPFEGIWENKGRKMGYSIYKFEGDRYTHKSSVELGDLSSSESEIRGSFTYTSTEITLTPNSGDKPETVRWTRTVDTLKIGRRELTPTSRF
jgi:hypothetical protein